MEANETNEKWDSEGKRFLYEVDLLREMVSFYGEDDS